MAWTVGPFPNPQETYRFYSLPFCQPEKQEHFHSEGLGETLLGYDLVRSAMPLAFKERRGPSRVCSKELDARETAQFERAIQQEYWYQLFLDDLPLWGMVGEGQGGTPALYTHTKLVVGYNDDRIIEVNLTAQNALPIRAGLKVDFTYEVRRLPLSQRGRPPP